MYERKHQRLLPRRAFYRRVGRHAALAALVIAASLGIGVIGYRCTCGMTWIDALLNASMILTGMGPVDAMPSVAAKLFASAYALFSGVVFLTVIAVVGAPILHRILHRFHLESSDRD